MTIKKTSAVTQSVANTAKRVIVIVGVAIVMGESLNPLKLAGCAIGIGGVFLYSIIDSLVRRAAREVLPSSRETRVASARAVGSPPDARSGRLRSRGRSPRRRVASAPTRCVRTTRGPASLRPAAQVKKK